MTRSILAFLLTARGDLPPAELADLVTPHTPGNHPVAAGAVRTRLQSVLHRTVRRSARTIAGAGPRYGDTTEERYQWSHETLPTTVAQDLGAGLIHEHTLTLHQ